MTNFFQSTHPKNGDDITIEYDEDHRLVNATYDNEEEVDITPRVKASLQSDIDTFVSN